MKILLPKLTELIDKMNTSFVFQADSHVEKISMERAIKLTDKIPWIFWLMVFIPATCVTIIVPIFSERRNIPVATWCPYNCTKSPQYEITIAWQYFCQLHMVQVYSSGEIIFPCLSILVAQQFKILGSNFKNCFYRSLGESGLSKERVTDFRDNLMEADLDSPTNADILALIETSQFHGALTTNFKDCVKHHRGMLSYCSDLDKFMNVLLMVKICNNTFLAVFIAFNIITTDNMYRVAFLGLYLCDSCFLSFICCGSGQILTNGAAALSPSLYESPWYLYDRSLKKTFLMVQRVCLQAVRIKAGNYFLMTHATFVTLMRAIFSYITLLHQVTSKSSEE